jgi:hypothetical protein
LYNAKQLQNEEVTHQIRPREWQDMDYRLLPATCNLGTENLEYTGNANASSKSEVPVK